MSFWSLVDEILNTLLFLLIGLEVLLLPFHWSGVSAAMVAIPLSIVVRAISVVLSTAGARVDRRAQARGIIVLTWGGLRGGISVALALGLPPSETRGPLLAVCYGVVVFTIVVQGLTIGWVARRLYPPVTSPAQPAPIT